MPRKKKNGQSSVTAPVSSTDTSICAGSNAGYGQGSNVTAMASNFPSSNTTMVNSDRDVIVRNMQEMFSHLDPEVIYIVLAECDFKVEHAMDSLLELSVAAEGIAHVPPQVSGFELTAAALLSPTLREPRSDLVTSTELPSSPHHPSPLTEVYDLLIDRELEILTKKQEGAVSSGGLCSSTSSSSTTATPLSSLPPPPLPQHVLPELLLGSLGAPGQDAAKRQTSTSGGLSVLDELSLLQLKQQNSPMPDFCHHTGGMSGGKTSNAPLDLAATGRPSAFQAYKRQGHSVASKGADWVVPPGGIVGGARAKVNVFRQELPNNMSWNTKAAVFSPRVHGNPNQGPAFITPVVLNPSPWNSQTMPASQWLGQRLINQAPLKPLATIPKSWTVPASSHAPPVYDWLRMEGKVLVLLRGAPGSGKSTLARALLGQNPGGVILSTDDYFSQNGKYLFDASALGQAHEWNHGRAKAAFGSGASPVIIDNTNLQSWEMRPYVAQAMRYRYKVLFREPDTWWKSKPRELERRTKHAVPVERIRRMLDNFERFVSIQSIMSSRTPERKLQRSNEDDNPPPQPMSSSGTTQPDLVGEPRFAKGSEKSHPQLYSSLPDVSSVATAGELGMPGRSSIESLISKAPENYNNSGNPQIPNDGDYLDFEGLDSELESHLELGYSFGDQGIPDCIVESVCNEDPHDNEMPVAFSESMAQRVRTERRSRRTDVMDRLEPTDLVREANQSEHKEDGEEGMDLVRPEGGERGLVGWGGGEEVGERKLGEWRGGEQGGEEEPAGCREGEEGGEKGSAGEIVRPELLEFVGDWPTEQVLEQRDARGRRRGKREEAEGEAEEAGRQCGDRTIGPFAGPDVTEFQKLLDLIETGIDSMLVNTSLSPAGGQLARENGNGEMGEAGCETEDNLQDSHRQIIYSERKDQLQDRGVGGRAELPDCVLDWKAVESTQDPPLNEMDESETSEQASGADFRAASEGSVYSSSVKSQSIGLVDMNHDSLHAFLRVDAQSASSADLQGNHSAEASQPVDGSPANEVADNKSDLTGTLVKGDGHIGEVTQSPVCEGGVEGSHLGGGSQERKGRQSRRSGKSCKLAFTFTQNCPPSSCSSPKALKESAQATAISVNLEPNIEGTAHLDCEPCFEPILNFDLNTNPSPNAIELETLPHSVVPDFSTQTDPLDFALLWRLARHDNNNNGDGGNTPALLDNQPCHATILLGSPSRFLPELSGVVSAADAVHPSDQKEVPYRVAHEKGTEVEEAELGATRSRLQNLNILSRHFKLVSFDTLEDLYDKCQHDLEWTTNLLLDSGERLFRDKGDDDDDGGCGLGEDGDQDLKAFVQYGGLGLALEAGLASSASNVLATADAHDGPSSGGDLQLQAPSNRSCSTLVGDEHKGDSHSVPGFGRLLWNNDVGSGDQRTVAEAQPNGFQGALSELMSVNEDNSALYADDKTLSSQQGAESRPIEAKSEVDVQVATPTETPEVEAELEGGASNHRDKEEEEEGEGDGYEELWSGDEPSNVEEMTQSLLTQLEEIERRGRRQKKKEQEEEERRSREQREKRRNHHMNIQSVELKLPTELAIQLTELFGPVGIDPGACSTDDYAVRMDLNLAKLLHQKWKDTIQEGQRQAALSFHLLQESSQHWGESQSSKINEGSLAAHLLIGGDAFRGMGSQSDAQDEVPFMDHWSASYPHVSLRAIMTEEQALQENMAKSRLSREVDKRNGASLLKESQLYSLFPTIDKHFLLDIFKDYSYNLVETEQFLRSLLDGGPAKTVVAPEPPRTDTLRTPSKEREKRRRPAEVDPSPQYQDVEDPEYQDFRAEACLQRARQQENFAKASEAHRQGQKDVASFYAQQGHLHGQKMREANHRAAVQIFERVNASLLPQNVLDLHGLHVDEALQHLAQVLLDKTNEYHQGLCSSKLSVITGRGNHSQGGVARIRPAVIEYLTNQHYRFTVPKMGLVLVSLN